jgi:membrane fusion protein (multidrug efflux system)
MKASEGFSPKEVDEARLRVSIATSELAELQLPIEDVREQQIRVLHEQIEAAKKQVAAHEAQLRQREVRAPMAGQVNLNRFEPGEVVKPEHVLGQIFDRRAWVVKLNLPEQALAHVAVGQKVKVSLAGYPTLKYGYLDAKIKYIIPVVTPRPNAPGIFYAEAALEVPPDFRIDPGMTASGWVDAGTTTWIKRKIGW